MLITQENKPRVKKLRGNKKRFTIGLIKRLIKVNKPAA